MRELTSPPADSRLRLAPGYSAAETHSHTTASDGIVEPEDLVAAAAAVGLGVICVTDHDTMASCAQAMDAGERHGVEVVPGEEVTTAAPWNIHVVGLFLDRQIRMGMSIEDTVDAIHDQGGLAVIPHPFMPSPFASAGPRRLRRMLETHTVDAIEVRHTAPMGSRGFARLDAFYADHRAGLGAALGAGDSHFGQHDLGRLVTAFPGGGASGLRAAIEARLTSPAPGPSPTPPPLSLRLAQQRRSLLWLPLERRAGRVGQGVGRARSAIS